MQEVIQERLGSGITCIDAGYVQPGLACFYLLEEGGECAVIETGTSHSVPRLQQVLRERAIAPEQVRYVIPTHVHLDHAGGAGAMMALFPEARLLVHPRGARHMIEPERLIAGTVAVYGEAMFRELYGDIRPVDADRVRAMEDGETVSLAGRTLEFRHTRGHAEHHFCVWDETSRGWFSGDMFGLSYPWCRTPAGDFVLPSTTPSQFDPDTFITSLDLLCGYRPQRLYLTHYGELPYAPDKAEGLREQIHTYCKLARSHGDDVVRLEEALGDYSVELMHRMELAGDEGAWRQSLAFDMRLNAQGLLAWHARIAADREVT
jgi:glyoxylase-like metal-dependent hydrolase (beta-lactamase superfamily II)